MKLFCGYVSALILIYCGIYVSVLFFFLAFIPLMTIADSGYSKPVRLLLTFTLLFSFCYLSTPWIVSLYHIYGVALLFINTFLFTLPFVGFFSKRKSRTSIIILFISLWLTIEYLILRIDFIPPFYLLGNTFAHEVQFIQFYQYTGVLGGTLWLLLVNSVGFYMIQSKQYFKCVISLCLLVLPLLGFSLYQYYCPNNSDKFSQICYFHINKEDKTQYSDAVSRKLINLLKEHDLKNTDFIVFPENTFAHHNRLELLLSNIEFFQFQKFLSNNNLNATMIVGAEISQKNNHSNELSTFNSAIIQTKDSISLITKSKFVPFEEKIPTIFKLFSSKSDYFQSQSTSHYVHHNNISAGVLICYEVLFGNYVSEQIGIADFLILLSREDGLLDFEQAKKQYQNISRLRCIEQNSYLVKSSISGYTGVIDNKGNIITQISDNHKTEPFFITIPTKTQPTFYSQVGDILGAFAISILCIQTIYLILSHKKM